jgi:hypothetical protein
MPRQSSRFNLQEIDDHALEQREILARHGVGTRDSPHSRQECHAQQDIDETVEHIDLRIRISTCSEHSPVVASPIAEIHRKNPRNSTIRLRVPVSTLSVLPRSPRPANSRIAGLLRGFSANCVNLLLPIMRAYSRAA